MTVKTSPYLWMLVLSAVMPPAPLRAADPDAIRYQYEEEWPTRPVAAAMSDTLLLVLTDCEVDEEVGDSTHTHMDVVVASFNPSGDLVDEWVYCTPGSVYSCDDYAIGFVLDSTNGCFYVLTADEDAEGPPSLFRTVKFDLSDPDTWVWVDTFDVPGDDIPVDIALHPYDSDVGVVVCGISVDTAVPGNGSDIYTRCLESDGSLRWEDWFDKDSSDADVAVALDVDGDGNVFVVGKGSDGETVVIKYDGNHVSGEVPAEVKGHDYGDEEQNMPADVVVVGDRVILVERFYEEGSSWETPDDWGIHGKQRQTGNLGGEGSFEMDAFSYHETPTALAATGAGAFMVGQATIADNEDDTVAAYILTARLVSGPSNLDVVWSSLYYIGESDDEEPVFGVAVAGDGAGNCFVTGTDEDGTDVTTLMYTHDGILRRVCWSEDAFPVDVADWRTPNDSWATTLAYDEGEEEAVVLRYEYPTLDYAWRELDTMPESPSGRPVKDGGWLAYCRAGGGIYAAKGHKKGDFYVYDIASEDWHVRTPIPDGAESKLPYRGCRGICDGDGSVYMTKGNNTLGFWRYSIPGGSCGCCARAR